MLMLASTHKALMASQDLLVAQLKAECEWLRLFIQPPPHPHVTVLNREADALLESRQEPLNQSSMADMLSLKDVEKMLEARVLVEQERDGLLSGAY